MGYVQSGLALEIYAKLINFENLKLRDVIGRMSNVPFFFKRT